MTYEEKRALLMKDGGILLGQKKTAGANAKMTEVEALDAEHNAEIQKLADAQAKADELKNAELTAQANAAALEEIKTIDLQMQAKDIKIQEVKEVMSNEPKIYNADSVEYREAFLRKLQGTMTETDKMVMAGVTTTQAGDAIPTQTVNKIIEKMTKLAPMIGEIDLQNIPGYVKFPVESTVNAAGLHTENAAVEPAVDTLTYVSLGGYEIVKVLQISATVEAMTIDAFESWVVSNLARSLADVIENYIINGTGQSQPKGIDFAETWTDGTNAVDWATNTTLADVDLTEQISYLPARCYGNAKWLLNPKTLWQKVMPIRDDGKYKIVTELPGGQYAIHGYPVLLSDKVADNDIFFGDFFAGVKANFARPITIASSAEAGFTTYSTLYRGACLYDNTTVAGNIIKSAPVL